MIFRKQNTNSFIEKQNLSKRNKPFGETDSFITFEAECDYDDASSNYSWIIFPESHLSSIGYTDKNHKQHVCCDDANFSLQNYTCFQNLLIKSEALEDLRSGVGKFTLQQCQTHFFQKYENITSDTLWIALMTRCTG
eukprot:Sdes_comp9663_c0_seq2m1165